MICRVAKATGCSITFLMPQHNTEPERVAETIAKMPAEEAAKTGANITPAMFARPVCILFSVQGENPFQYLPSYAPLKNLPLAEKVACDA